MDSTEPVPAVPDAPWKPVGALVISSIFLLGAIPTLIGGVGYLAGAAFGPDGAALGMLLVGAVLTISALAVGIPTTMYLFRYQKRYFVAGLIGFGVGLVLLFSLAALMFVELTGGFSQVVVK